MRTSLIFLVGLVCFAAAGELRARPRTFTPDLRAPVMQLKTLLKDAEGFNLGLVIKLVLDIINNCLPEIIGLIPPPAQALISNPKMLKDLIPLNLTEDITAYMNSTDFEDIHNHLWNDDQEWNDVIQLFYKAGWNENFEPGAKSIYQYFQELYHYFKCDLPIPNGPPTVQQSQMRMHISRTATQEKSTLPLPFLELFQEQPVCNSGEIFQMILDSKLIPVINLAKFVIIEVKTDASVHLLWATLTEPVKGVSFRETRLLPAFKKLINHWDSQLKQNELFQFVFQILSGISGIDFGGLNINVVANLISFVEFLMWGTPFPRPT